MAYDGDIKQFTKTKPDVFSLEGLIAWLETQDAATRYNYVSSSGCLLCRYFRSNGVQCALIDRDGITPEYRLELLQAVKYPGVMADVALANPWTYGGALSRARMAVR